MKRRLVEYHGQLLSVSEAARLAGLRPQTLEARLRRGNTLELALLRPTHTPRSSGRLGARRSPWIALGYLRVTASP